MPAWSTVASWLSVLLCAFVLPSPGWTTAIGAPPTIDDSHLGDLSLEELLDLRIEKVYGASRYEQQVTRAPASVTIVTGEEIRNFGYRTLADLLRGVRGLFVTNDRAHSSLGIRGFSRPGDFNTRMLLLVDGHRMNDVLYGSALVGSEATLDLGLVERVEIIRGPSSSIYGASAFFGVISVVTRAGAQLDGVEASAEGGSFESYRGWLAYGRKLDSGLEVTASASRHDSAGQRRLYYPEFDRPETSNGIATNADGEAASRFFGRLVYRDFTLAGAYARRAKEVPLANFGTAFNAGREETTNQRIYLDLKMEHSFSPQSQLLIRTTYDRSGFRGDYPYDLATAGGPPLIVESHDDNYGEGVGAEVQLTQRIFARHVAVFGAEYRDDLHLSQSSFSDRSAGYSFLSDTRSRSLGLYAQAEVELASNLVLNAGLRYDRYDGFGGTLHPRFGLIYSPLPATNVKVLYGSAFRAPNAFERYYESPAFIKANPNLQPETIRTYELVLEQYLSHGLLFSVSGYRYGIRQLITASGDPVDGLQVYRNVDTVNAWGLELALEKRMPGGLLARASYARQRAEDGRDDRKLSSSPRHMAKLNLSLPLSRDRWSAALEMQYLSNLLTLKGNETPDSMLANVTFRGRRLARNLDLSISLYNLFDRAYSFPGTPSDAQDAIPQDGRTLRVVLSARVGSRQ